MIRIYNFPCTFIFTYFITGRPAPSAAMPILFLLSGPKMGFPPSSLGRHVAPINVKFGTGERTMPNFTFIGAKMWEHRPQNWQNFEFWP